LYLRFRHSLGVSFLYSEFCFTMETWKWCNLPVKAGSSKWRWLLCTLSVHVSVWRNRITISSSSSSSGGSGSSNISGFGGGGGVVTG